MSLSGKLPNKKVAVNMTTLFRGETGQDLVVTSYPFLFAIFSNTVLAWPYVQEVGGSSRLMHNMNIDTCLSLRIRKLLSVITLIAPYHYHSIQSTTPKPPPPPR